MNSLVSKRLQQIGGSGSLKFACVSLLLAVLFGLTPLPAIAALVFLLAALTAVLPVKQFGVVTRIFMGIMLLVSLNTVTGLLAWLVHISLSPGPLSALYAVVLLAVIAMSPKTVKRYAPKKLTVAGIEIVALVLAACTMGVLLRPLLTDSSAVGITRILTFTDDNTSHLTLVRATIDTGRYLYGNDTVVKDGLVGNTAYPQGWHLNTALIEKSFGHDVTSPRKFLLIYYSTAVVWVGLLAYLFTVTAYAVARSANRNSNLAMTAAAAIVVGSSLFVGTVFQLFTWGAHPQLTSYALLLGMLLLCAELSDANAPKKFLTSCLLLLGAGVSFVYYFQLPIVLLFSAIFLGFTYKKKLFTFWKQRELFLYGVILAFSIVPILLYVIYIGQGQSSVVNAAGGTLSYANLFIVGISLLAGLYVLRSKTVLSLWIGALLAGSFVFMALLMVYQQATAGSLSYYSFKASQTVVFLASVVLVVLGTEALTAIFNSKSFVPRRAVAPLLLVVAIAFATTNHAPLSDIYLHNNANGLSESLAKAVVDASQSKTPQTAVTVGSCASYFDVRATHMIMALSGKGSAYQAEIANAQFDSTQGKKVFGLIGQYSHATSQTITVIGTNLATTDSLKQSLGAVQSQVRFVNVTDGAAAVACPLRLSL